MSFITGCSFQALDLNVTPQWVPSSKCLVGFRNQPLPVKWNLKTDARLMKLVGAAPALSPK